MNRIGVVGPLASVERIFEIANESEHEIEFIPFPYDESQEAKRIVQENQHQVNGWFFSGPVPYRMAEKVLGAEANYVYSPYTGSSLYKCLLRLFNEHKSLDGISIDMIFTENLQESFDELEFPIENIFFKSYDENYDPAEIIQFHMKLWKEGKIQAVLTSLNSVYKGLIENNVPVYRISITKMEMRQALNVIIEKVKSSYFKDTQIGVEIIEFNSFDQIFKKANTRFHLLQLELKIKQTLLHLCEKLDGSFMEIGSGRYQIFSTRGAIEREIDMLQVTVNQLTSDSTVPVAVGIGYGETASSAEINALKAVQYSKEKPDYGIVMVQEDGVMIEEVGKDSEIVYSFRSENKELLDKLHHANISLKTFNKIVAVNHLLGWKSFTTVDIATQLSMTKRNAQRIIASLCEIGLVDHIGEEAHAHRGRPSKIYQLKTPL